MPGSLLYDPVGICAAEAGVAVAAKGVPGIGDTKLERRKAISGALRTIVYAALKKWRSSVRAVCFG